MLAETPCKATLEFLKFIKRPDTPVVIKPSEVLHSIESMNAECAYFDMFTPKISWPHVAKQSDIESVV